ncbi:hypothetical protein SmJEL517_g04613 [Synchytrium microbalum]|uniref:von Willebrand factor A domain-containing protein 8 n=1 Tax=Synchytrium microbalum TaxID=1806994 RepID=A0A507BXM2_9FUNG|nr:uncharacterized protein SmJEL517_g04613 [Synchytrium microbalum]TPX32182.1 hypothetical protein SmJEL517_g04613 [Synchytrium microbalum]
MSIASRRLKQLQLFLGSSYVSDEEKEAVIANLTKKLIEEFSISDVTLKITLPGSAELVPDVGGLFYDDSQEILRHLRWMMQKDRMGQDIFFLGPPGSFKRRLVMRYAQLAQREIEYVALSKDVTDSDLKQRREILSGSAFYTDGPAVRAALHGRILILDGIEKAERNVLPVLNNLLENREMALEDGRFLTHPKRFDTLVKSASKEELEKWNLVRVSERFFVIALGLPVPKYEGHPLDPPLRSRFQARNIAVPTFLSQITQLKRVAPKVPQRTLERLISVGFVLRSVTSEKGVAVPEFPAQLDHAARILQSFPDTNLRCILDIMYPYPLLSGTDEEQRSIIESTYQRFDMLGHSVDQAGAMTIANQATAGYKIINIVKEEETSNLTPSGRIHHADVTFETIVPLGVKPTRVTVRLAAGEYPTTKLEKFVETEYHGALLATMMVAHSAGDLCIIGEKGAGKSALLRSLTSMLGYKVELIPLYKDMSARDLMQRRSTNLLGDTIWENSPLIKAAIEGSIAILDQIEVLSFGTLATIQRLTSEREMVLPDGTQLVHPNRYVKLIKKSGFTPAMMKEKKIVPVHPNFRVISIARPTVTAQGGAQKGNWLSPEICSLFRYIPMRSLSYVEEMYVIQMLCPGIEESKLKALLTFANVLRSENDETARLLASSLSTRQLIRVCRRMAMFPDEDMHNSVQKVSLSRFLPSMAKDLLTKLLLDAEIEPAIRDDEFFENLKIEIINNEDGSPQAVRIGDVMEPVAKDTNPVLIPDIVFHENPKQSEILMEMIKDYQLGEHLCLIGNQGVGKNKLTDKFLQVLRLPREYIQLHRDTTVYSLTSTPSIVDGVLVYEDSPLVKAVKNGYILVVDEADKAPTHVTSILKSLVEDGEMVLSDGRRIVKKDPMLGQTAITPKLNVNGLEEYIVLHPSFRMFVLANRPGFPFLGNDFFREIGDVFACHCVDNPDTESELALLRAYAPDVQEDLLRKLTAAFNDLRRLVDEGLISYPYSTRELVSVVKHLQTYPKEGLSRALQNVFDFDQYESEIRDLLIETLNKNGIPTGMESDFRVELGIEFPLPEPRLVETWYRRSKPNTVVQVKVAKDKANARGNWRVNMPEKWLDVDRSEARSTLFTEQVYAFKLPTKGECLDLMTAADGTMMAITTNPVTLNIVTPNHRQQIAIDLYEYFPLQKSPPFMGIDPIGANFYIAPPRLRLAEPAEGKICLHNPSDHTLLLVDLGSGSINSIMLGIFEFTGPSFMNRSLMSEGFLIFYQEQSEKVAIIDFSDLSQYNIVMPVKVGSIQVVTPDKWFVQDYDYKFDIRKNYIMSKADPSDKFPTVFEPLDTRPVEDKAKVIQVEDIGTLPHDRFDYYRTHRFALLPSRESHASAVVGMPESLFDFSTTGVELITWDRDTAKDTISNKYINILNAHLHLRKSQQLAVVVPQEDGRAEGYLELVDTHEKNIRRIHMPLSLPSTAVHQKDLATIQAQSRGIDPPREAVQMLELEDGRLLTVDLSGFARVWQTNYAETVEEMERWKKLVGSLDAQTLRLVYGDGSGDGDGDGDGEGEGNGNGEGKGDGKGEGEGEGEGKGQGGTGEGSGGSGGGGGEGGGAAGGASDPADSGEARQSGKIDFTQFNLRAPNDVTQEITDAVKDAHELAMRKRLAQIQMTSKDMEMFNKYRDNVQREVRELRTILEAVEAKNRERVWLKNQTTGDIDDTRLIEGVTGERAIYKRRGENESDPGFQQKPKRMFFQFDLSASMTRFNGHDNRLERSLECALLIMEAFKNFEHKFQYRIAGHSGDGPDIEFVSEGKYPKNEKEQFQIIAKMNAHSQYCLSGDNTILAATTAIKNVVKEEGDDYFVLVLSDANIAQYNISPAAIGKALKADDRVNAYMVFIGTIGDQATTLMKAAPGSSFVCFDNKDLPKIIKSMFLSSLLKG